MPSNNMKTKVTKENNDMQNFKNGLNKMKLDLGILKKEYCTEKEEKEYDRLKNENVPILDEIYIDNANHYYRCVDAGMTKQEIDELLLYRQIDYLRTIKNILSFLAVVLVIFLFAWSLSFFLSR